MKQKYQIKSKLTDHQNLYKFYLNKKLKIFENTMIELKLLEEKLVVNSQIKIAPGVIKK